MLSNPIESEIEVEHKVFRDFNVRQVICLIIGGFIGLCMYVYFRDVVLMVGFSLPFGLVLGVISRKDDNGRTAEEVFIKKAAGAIYRNDKRVFRTRNRYVKLVNEEHERTGRSLGMDSSVGVGRTVKGRLLDGILKSWREYRRMHEIKMRKRRSKVKGIK